MADKIYQKLKKQNGEKFAQAVRNHHSGLLEIPTLLNIVRFAGRDAAPLLPYLMAVLAEHNKTKDVSIEPAAPEDPFVLLERAGYQAFHADTLKKQNSIMRYFVPGELLCTFRDASRYRDYHIVHAIRRDADDLKRGNFKDKEERQDAYGTSVISIQMRKSGGFISIKNRYNHAVSGCDNTFNSNPDKIIQGLTHSLKAHFNVEFDVYDTDMPNGYHVFNGQIFHYYQERDNIYFGDQAWVKNGEIKTADRGKGEALFDTYLFNSQTKTLQPLTYGFHGGFAEDFNHYYGGNPGLKVDRNGNLTLDGETLIGADRSRIVTLNLPAFEKMSSCSLSHAFSLKRFDAPKLKIMEPLALNNAPKLESFYAPQLQFMGNQCLKITSSLKNIQTPNLQHKDYDCFWDAPRHTKFSLHAQIALRKIRNTLFGRTNKAQPAALSAKAPSL